MKHLLSITLLLYIAFPSINAQNDYRSEIVRTVSYIELKGDKLIQTDSTTIQINERMGDHDAKVARVYSKGDKVSYGDAWIEDMNGKIVRKLKGSEITDQSYIRDISHYEDQFIKWFELKHNTYPYRIVYTCKTTTSRYLSATSFDYTRVKQPVRYGKIVIEAPIDQPIKYKQRSIASPRIDTLAKTVNYAWEFEYTPLKNEKYSSDNTSQAPALTVLPARFKYGEQGDWDSWQSFGNWVSRLNKKKDDLPDTEKEKINNLLAGVADHREKAKILYHYLQDNQRYINVSVKTGGMESYPVSYVCANRYGDCKALSTYMKSALNYAGIKSYYTLVDHDDRITDIDPEFPSQMFNHVIVTVPFPNDTVYLECTSKSLPFGYVHSSIQGRPALMIDESNSHFTLIPAMKPEDVLCEREFQVSITSGGYADVQLKTKQQGEHYEESNFLASGINKNTADKYIRNTILSGTYNLLDYKFEDKDRDDKAIVLSANLQMNNVAKKYGNNLLISSFPIDITLFEKPEQRKQDVQIDYPEFYKDTFVYSFTDMQISKIPENISIDSPFGRYVLDFKLADNKLTVSKTILINSGRYTLEQYGDFYKFMTSIKDYEYKKFNLEIL